MQQTGTQKGINSQAITHRDDSRTCKLKHWQGLGLWNTNTWKLSLMCSTHIRYLCLHKTCPVHIGNSEAY